MPKPPLPFLTIVVASTNDPNAEISRTVEMINDRELVNISNVGRIDASSGIGIWQQGPDILHWPGKVNRPKYLLSA